MPDACVPFDAYLINRCELIRIKTDGVAKAVRRDFREP